MNHWKFAVTFAVSALLSQFLVGQTTTFPSLFPGRCYPSGNVFVAIGEFDLLSADVDADGFVDLLSIDPELDVLTVLTNDGNGNFEPMVKIPIPDEVALGATGNFNSDNVVDFLLLPEFASGRENIFWIVSSTDGLTFEVSDPIEKPETSKLPFFFTTSTVEVGDFNGDGLDDILFAGAFRDAIVLLNNGSNQFSLQAEIEIFLVFLTEPVVFDMDGDGDLDVVFSADIGQAIFLNDGDANFNSIGTASDISGEIAIGDLNKDGTPDLVVSSRFPSGQIIVFLNDGDLGFEQAALFEFGLPPLFIELADINGDGDLDIAIGEGVGTFVFENNGDAEFGEPRLIFSNSPSNSSKFAFADIENDGDDDILLEEFGRICVIETENGEVPGIFSSLGSIDVTPDVIELMDVDNDSDLDLVTIDPNLGVFLNDGNGVFAEPQVTNFGFPAIFVDLGIGDVNNDSNVDLVILTDDPQQVSVVLSDGRGNFELGPVVALPGEFQRAIALADFDSDSDLDFAATYFDSVSEEGIVCVGLNQGDGSFAIQDSVLITQNFLTDLAIGDFDGDLDFDIAVATNNAQEAVVLLFNAGDATFPVSSLIPANGGSTEILAADLNGDFDTDLVVSSSATDEVTIFDNDGTGEMTQIQSQVTAFQSELAVADLDCDGRIDVSLGGFELLRNLGDSTFAPSESYYAAFGSVRTAIGDVDGDGNLDFVTAGSGDVGFQISYSRISDSGDLNRDGEVNLLDVAPFVDALTSVRFQKEADTNLDGTVDLLDISEFVKLLSN